LRLAGFFDGDFLAGFADTFDLTDAFGFALDV